MVLFLSLSLTKDNKRFTIWHLAPILITIALILTKSLGAWLSLISAFVILFLLSCKSFKYKRLLMPLFIISTIFIIFFIMFSRHERLLDLNNPQNSITQRLNYWRTAIAIIKDHPVSGVGLGNFQEVFLDYKIGLETDTRYAHNIFLHQWAETGILGFIGLLLLVAIFFKKSLSKSKYLFSAGLVFILHNLVDITYFVPQSGLYWWIILGL
ncbi:MAG: O-antigen ligase family protein [Candidatus Omnitrophica bacterium]|nr:O-antigen ligase family protein [Candidatus Omnitrophota bacterium]